MADDFALVKCANCGEYVPVAWELLGETKPDEITDWLCGACDDGWEEGYDFEDGVDEDEQ